MAIARDLVTRHHYARGASKQAVAVHGLFAREDSFWDQRCRGVAWWLPPSRAVAVSLGGGTPTGVLGLSRLAVAPDVPGNAATFLMARSMRLIDRSRWPVFVTYADTWRGHTGAIYRATGWREDGRTVAKPVYTLHGRLVSAQAADRTRTHAEMIGMGATFEGRFPKIRFVAVRR